DALRERLGTPLPPVFRPEYDQALAALRSSLGARKLTELLAAGRAISEEQAIALALGETEGDTLGSSRCNVTESH
ncbi:MAG: hypothetical protein NT069_20175, partial [Planctomycetota bacterium]|nr:hypothetical protein [Planctomycetota bacterium]